MPDLDIASLQRTVVWSTFALGVILGAVMNRTNFCTMGAVSDIVNIGDWTRMRMWLGAIGVGILATQFLGAAGLVDLSKAIYTGPTFSWLAYVVGGLLFGFGMVLASGCGSKTLVRVGGGSLKAMTVFIVLGLFAYMTLRGVFGVIRVDLIEPVNTQIRPGQDLPRIVAGSDPNAVPMMRIAIGTFIGLGLIAFALAGREFRRLDPMLSSLVVGLVIAAGWFVTGSIGHVAEHPDTLQEAFVATNSGRPESFTFVAPIAYTLELLMFWSDKSKFVSTGIAAVAGTIAGSMVYALATGRFHWEGFRDAEDTGNHLVGGALMGIGGVTALGCTVGQGLSGMSTLALGSLVAFLSIIAGAMLALRYQIWRVERMV